MILFIIDKLLFANALQNLETCLSVNNKLSAKLASSLKSPIPYDEIFKVTSIPFFIPDFNLLNFELDKCTFKLIY